MTTLKTLSGRLLAVLALATLAACAQYNDKRGVEVTWNPAAMQDLSVGETTRKQVMAELGPPSQVISLDGETVLYYLYERSAGNGLILIVYNRFTVDTRYDRAVFFFDENDVLSEYASYIDQDDA